jgi:hypothetical protein
MRISRIVATLAVATSLLTFPSHASAAPSDEDIATARSLAQDGVAALQHKDFKTAEARFEQASKLYPVPTVEMGLARARVGLGKFVAAQNAFQKVINEGMNSPNAAFARVAEDAKTESAAIQGKIGSVVITLAGGDNPTLTIDDAPVSAAIIGVKRPIDPGTHVVRAASPGYKSAEVRFDVREGGAATALLTLEKNATAAVVLPPTTPGQTPAAPLTPPPAEPSSNGSTQRTLGYVGLGVGGAGLVLGVITGIAAIGKHGDLKSECPNGVCPASDQSAVNSYKSLGGLSTVGFIVAAVAGGTGAALLFSAPKRTETGTPSAFIRPMIGPGSIGAFGEF